MFGDFKKNNSIFFSTGVAGWFVFSPFYCFTVLEAIQARHYLTHDATQLLFFLKVGSNCTSFKFSGVSTQPSLFEIEIGLLEGFVGHVLLIFPSEI